MLEHLSSLNESENVSRSIGNLPFRVRKANTEKVMNNIRNEKCIAEDLLEFMQREKEKEILLYLLELFKNILLKSYKIIE